MSDTKKRVITGALMVIVFVPVLWIGGIAVDILLAILGILAGYETTVMLDTNNRFIVSIFSSLAILAMIFLNKEMLIITISIYLIAIMTFRIITDRIKTETIGPLLIMTILVGLGFHEFRNIFSEPNSFDHIIFILIATTFCDVGAWLFGKMFGKHKLCPTISPKKTWEGSIGGYLCGAICSFIYALIRHSSFNILSALILSLFIPFVSQIGDLTYSCIKREFGIKDFGYILPGHGGILDRFDSLTFSLITYYIVTTFIK